MSINGYIKKDVFITPQRHKAIVITEYDPLDVKFTVTTAKEMSNGNKSSEIVLETLSGNEAAEVHYGICSMLVEDFGASFYIEDNLTRADKRLLNFGRLGIVDNFEKRGF